MNQFIQIQDGFELTDDPDRFVIQAINGGDIVRCVINGLNGRSAADIYAEYQFDLEEALIDLICEEAFNQQGEVSLSIKDLKV